MSNDDWLTDQCNRLKYGQCSSLSCLKRGGFDKKVHLIDYTKATCPAYEILQELRQLRRFKFESEKR